jgi:sugar-specific transcriptional regulator TrmB
VRNRDGIDDGVVQNLRTLGLSLYEARIYLGLLKHGPQNGNELSRSARLPSSKVYSTLENLAGKGIVHPVRRGSTTEYYCISPEELLHRFRTRFSEPLDQLETVLPSLAAFQPAAAVLTVTGIEALHENARSIANRAVREVYLSVWADELPHLEDSLLGAEARGARIFGMLYGADELPRCGSWMQHAYQDIVAERIAGRMLTIVVDAEEALVAHVPRQGEASGVRTRNPVLCLIAREYLHHDIVLQRAQNAIGLERWDERWQADPELRSLIFGSVPEASERRSRRRTKAKKEAAS